MCGRARAAPVNSDHEVVLARHDAARTRRERARAHPRHVVRAEDRVDRKALEQPVGHHRFRAAAVLLGRLEDETHGAVEILALGQQLRGAEHHRHVAVVPARMHLAGRARRVFAARRVLGDVQRVHVRADADRALAGAGRQVRDSCRRSRDARRRASSGCARRSPTCSPLRNPSLETGAWRRLQLPLQRAFFGCVHRVGLVSRSRSGSVGIGRDVVQAATAVRSSQARCRASTASAVSPTQFRYTDGAVAPSVLIASTRECASSPPAARAPGRASAPRARRRPRPIRPPRAARRVHCRPRGRASSAPRLRHRSA